MSLGGFAAGMAGAFQKAEDRYQERKLREQASAEAKLRQAAGFAFKEKMYTRQMRDAYDDELTKTRNYLSTVFGDTPEGRQYVSALLPFGESAIEIVKDHRQQAQDRGVPLTSFMKIAHPNGLDKNTYKAPDLDNVMSYLSKKKFGESIESNFKLPTVTFETFKKEVDYSPFVGSTFEATFNLTSGGIQSAMAEIEQGYNVEVNKRKVKDLEAIRKDAIAKIEAENASSGSGSSASEFKANLVSTYTKETNKNLEAILGSDVFVKTDEDQYTFNFEGNEGLALSGIDRVLDGLPKTLGYLKPTPNIQGGIKTFIPMKAAITSYFNNAINPANIRLDALIDRAYEQEGLDPKKRDSEFAAIDLTEFDLFGNNSSLQRLSPQKMAEINAQIKGAEGVSAGVIKYKDPETGQIKLQVSNGFAQSAIQTANRDDPIGNPLGITLYDKTTLEQLYGYMGIPK